MRARTVGMANCGECASRGVAWRGWRAVTHMPARNVQHPCVRATLVGVTAARANSWPGRMAAVAHDRAVLSACPAPTLLTRVGLLDGHGLVLLLRGNHTLGAEARTGCATPQCSVMNHMSGARPKHLGRCTGLPLWCAWCIATIFLSTCAGGHADSRCIISCTTLLNSNPCRRGDDICTLICRRVSSSVTGAAWPQLPAPVSAGWLLRNASTHGPRHLGCSPCGRTTPGSS